MNFNTPRLTELASKRNAEYAKKTTLIAEIASIRARMAKESPSDGNAADNRVRAILGEAILPDSVEPRLTPAARRGPPQYISCVTARPLRRDRAPVGGIRSPQDTKGFQSTGASTRSAAIRSPIPIFSYSNERYFPCHVLASRSVKLRQPAAHFAIRNGSLTGENRPGLARWVRPPNS